MSQQTIAALATELFDYALPDDRIAQTPLTPRDLSRLLHVTQSGALHDSTFASLSELLQPGDLLVANETRVRAARLHGRRDNGGPAELLVLSSQGDAFACLVRPARRLPDGARITIAADLVAVVGAPADGHPGARLVTFSGTSDVAEAIERYGRAPLPPYIRTRLDDPSRYQTTYATGSAVSAAAPTAGLHFTDAVRRRLTERGIGWATLRLEVGLGTFSPIRTDDISAHLMHEERYALDRSTALAINETRARGGRIIAVGTTSMRVLETCTGAEGITQPGAGSTRLYITPGHHFSGVDGLLTNFHQPRSSLLVLVAAFIGIERWREAYAHALSNDYRFLSFGDCMLCWKSA